MTTFWDTSALINAFLSQTVYARLHDGGRHFTRPHAMVEFFSTMTGRGIKMNVDGQLILTVLTPEDAAEWLLELSTMLDWLDLDGKEVVQALSKAQSIGIQGGHVYDYLHAEAAKKVKADKFLTRNTNDFKGLTGQAALEWP